MKIKVHKSRVSQKGFSRPKFPVISSSDIDAETQKEKSDPKSVFKTVGEAEIKNYTSGVGYYDIKDFKMITLTMKGNAQKFGKHLNTLITAFSDIVDSQDGEMAKFEGTGAAFAFRKESSPVESIHKAVITALKMRYVLNKMNRNWDFIRGDAWNIGVGITFGPFQIREWIEKGERTKSITGKVGSISKGIGKSCGKSQIILSDDLFIKFPVLENRYDLSRSRHVPVKGADYLLKVREVLGLVGPQAKRIYDEFV